MSGRIAGWLAAAVALLGTAAAQASQLSELFVYDTDGHLLWLVAPDAHAIAFRGVDGLRRSATEEASGHFSATR